MTYYLSLLAQAIPASPTAASAGDIGMLVLTVTALLVCVNQAVQIFASLRSNPDKYEPRGSVAQMQSSMETQMRDLRTSMDTRMGRLENDVTDSRKDIRDDINKLHSRVDDLVEKVGELVGQLKQ